MCYASVMGCHLRFNLLLKWENWDIGSLDMSSGGTCASLVAPRRQSTVPPKPQLVTAVAGHLPTTLRMGQSLIFQNTKKHE